MILWILLVLIIISIILIYNTDVYYFLSFLNEVWTKKDEKVFYDTNEEWCKKLRDNYKEIRREFITYQNKNKIPGYIEISDAGIPLDSQDEKWRVLILDIFGNNTQICKHFPLTCSLLKQVPGCRVSLFSVVDPNKKIPPHRGPNKCVLRYHLGLIVPKEKEYCFITVNNETRYWEEGKDIIFDDSYEHSVENNTNEQRVVLFLDIQKKYNVFLDTFNNILFYFIKNNSTLMDIFNNVNNYDKDNKLI